MRTALLAALLAGCAATPGGAPSPTALRSSATSMPMEGRAGPGVYTPLPGIAAPAAGISRRCVPQQSGFAADCQAM